MPSHLSTIRIMLAQMDVQPGRPVENTTRMLETIRRASEQHVQLLIFPEMAIPGYLLGDEWEREAFLRECEQCAEQIRAASQSMIIAFGSVGVDWKLRNEDGRVRKYNALFIADHGRFVGPEAGPYPFAIKTLMPNYREFDDSRHFFDLRKLAAEQGKPLASFLTPVRTSRLTLGCILCEDAWDTDYAVSPLSLLAQTRPDLFLNASCSPFTGNKNNKRSRVFSAHAKRLGAPFVYVNNVGIQNNGKTVFTFDGSSCIYDSKGGVLAAGLPFQECYPVFDIPMDGTPFGKTTEPEHDDISDIEQALSFGTRKFMDLCGVRKIVIGLSGGIDSAVVAALYSRLVDRNSLLLVNMPGRFTSPTTRNLAAALARNLHCLYAEIPIPDSVAVTQRQLDDLKISSPDGKHSTTLQLTQPVIENIQARDRSARILAAVAAAFGGVFTCNANKSEATVGYTTLYGDLGGYLANIADLWKMEVYALAEYLNRSVFGSDVIPQGIFDVTPSAELSPEQNVDQKKGDPLIYPYHDCLFRSWVESWNRTTPEEILQWYAENHLEESIGYKGKINAIFPTPATFIADLERWWNQYQGIGIVKRVQAPPILAVKRRAFGFDHRESIMPPRYTRRYAELKTKLLQ